MTSTVINTTYTTIPTTSTTTIMIVLTFCAESESGNGGDAMTRGPLRGRLFHKAKVKSLRMTAVIVAAFIICWTPYEVILIIHLITNIETVEHRYTVWIFFFGMTNSMVNPLIYGAFNIACKGKHR